MKKLFLVLIVLLLTACDYHKYSEDKTVSAPTTLNEEQIDRHLMKEIGSLPYEQLVVAFFNNNEVIDIGSVNNGNQGEVQISFNDIFHECMVRKCNGIIIAHNHPDKPFAHPSQADTQISVRFKEVLKKHNINLINSIIVTKYDTTWIL